MTSNARWISVAAGGRSTAGTVSQPTTLAVGAEARPGSSRGRGSRSPNSTRPWISNPAQDLGHPAGGAGDILHRGELDRLVGGDLARGSVPDQDLHRGQGGGERERDREPDPVVAVAPAAQEPDRVHRGDPEPGHQIRSKHHVRRLVGARMIEIDAPGVNRDDPAAPLAEPLGVVHPGVDRHHRHGASDSTQRHRDAAPEMRPAPKGGASRTGRSR